MTHPRDEWWVINGAEVLAALQDAHEGTDPHIVYVELFANSETAPPGDDS